MRRPDRYRRLRAAVRKADHYRMKGRVREEFLARARRGCSEGSR